MWAASFIGARGRMSSKHPVPRGVSVALACLGVIGLLIWATSPHGTPPAYTCECALLLNGEETGRWVMEPEGDDPAEEAVGACLAANMGLDCACACTLGG